MLKKSLATTTVAVLLIVSLAANADKPAPVVVTNPVLPVEVSNADPIPVTIAGSSGSQLFATLAQPQCDFLIGVVEDGHDGLLLLSLPIQRKK
jgi:hypothetical protein